MSSVAVAEHVHRHGRSAAAQTLVEAWLAHNATRTSAQVVYRTWLDAGGDLGVVRNPIVRWIERHATKASAGLVYVSWLSAKGSVDAVRAVRPAVAKPGRRTRFRFVLTSAGATTQPVAGATVSFASRRARTDSCGRATITALLRPPGTYRAGSAGEAVAADRRNRPGVSQSSPGLRAQHAS